MSQAQKFLFWFLTMHFPFSELFFMSQLLAKSVMQIMTADEQLMQRD